MKDALISLIIWVINKLQEFGLETVNVFTAFSTLVERILKFDSEFVSKNGKFSVTWTSVLFDAKLTPACIAEVHILLPYAYTDIP